VNSVRRAAREIALLVLFWADLQEGDGAESVLTLFRDNMLDDEEILREVLALPEGKATTIRKQLNRLTQSEQHWAFVERLVVGVASHLNSIDDMIGRFSNNWKVARMARVDRNVLRLAAYELIFELDIPTRATLNEAIEIAKRYGSVDSGKFVNGILDRIAQELDRV
jgi:transcription antitermination protein NusB